jgi:trehalose 6-phosphate phosphatase
LALISGRPLAELDALLQPWHGAAAGLHGIERRRADGALDRTMDRLSEAALDQIRPELTQFAARDSRLIVEDKGGTIALHYRAAPEREPEILSFGEALRRQTPALRLIAGKMVIEFQPSGVNKGLAVAAFMHEPPFAGRCPVFVGDDTTDEDGFAEVGRRKGIGIRVGPRQETAATHGLPSVAAVLAWLAEASCR